MAKKSRKPIASKGKTTDNEPAILKDRHHSLLFRFFASIMRGVTRKTTFELAEPIEAGSCVIANHCQMWGPIMFQLWYPRKKRIWCTGHVLEKKGSAEYAMREFWPDKPKWSHPFWWCVAHTLIPHLAVPLLQSADTLAVFHDLRLRDTFNDSLTCLTHGIDNIIFPESHEEGNGIVMKFHPHFVDIARLYKRRTGRDLKFYPAYLSPVLKRILVGHPVTYDSTNAPDAERVRIHEEVTKEITRLALSLPRHKVCPYLNYPRKKWRYNKDPEKETNKK